MPPADGVKTPIDLSLIDRVSGVFVGAIKGATDAWFGPQQPLVPVATPDVPGRAFDYPVAANLQFRPRAEQGQNSIDFPTLRALADPTIGGLDLVRLAIETRKDQMSAQNWTIRPRREDEDDKSPLTPGEKALCASIKAKLRRPDGIVSFRTWQRMLIEDLLVIDAPTVYLKPSTGIDLVPEVIDGATIKRLIKGDGRTPTFPDPAYQQALKGLPAVQYTTQELVYAPRNLRSDRLYGMSPTEQVVTTINIALRRQLSQLEFYTAGSVPDTIIGLPETWKVEQIRQFQSYWDSILSGNTEERRRARFVPGGVKPYPLKPDALKDDYDEWLSRIICWCYSLSPGALVRDMTRATAESNANTSKLEGLEPLKLWFSDLMDEVMEKAFVDGASVRWAWADEEINDPRTKAEVFKTATGGKAWMTADEVRAEYGKQPLTPDQQAELNPPAPTPFGSGSSSDPLAPLNDLGLVAKVHKAKPVPAIDHERASIIVVQREIQQVVKKFLGAAGKATAAAIRASGAHDAERPPVKADWGKLEKSLSPILARGARDGAAVSLMQVAGIRRLKRVAKADDEAKILASLDLANEKGMAWAKTHAGEAVTNIKASTEEMVRAKVLKALEEGWSNDELADELEESEAFGESRAEMIARTETAMADLEGNRIGWRESGLVKGRRWLVSDADTCGACLEMADVEVEVNDSFEDGDPPLHPNCRCAEVPVLEEEEEG